MNTHPALIKQISYTETYPIRQVVLRPNRPLETCFFDGDSLTTTYHFGAFQNENLAGIISAFKNKHSSFEEKNQYQIRGMAVLPEFQKYGLGKQLVLHTEEFLKQQKTELIWFNAREEAVGFYQKLGYKIIGDAFIIPDVGIHFVMFKSL